MNVQHDIERLVGASSIPHRIGAARRLSLYTHENRVMDALCAAAVRTDCRELREVIIEALGSNPAGACTRFTDDALWSQDSTVRRWALVNLSLMGCRKAAEAVISGFYDPDPAVREAAAMNVGLYNDRDVHEAFTHYFEQQRLDLLLAVIDGRRKTAGAGAADGDDELLMKTVLL